MRNGKNADLDDRKGMISQREDFLLHKKEISDVSHVFEWQQD